eukprot:TRINITY_DN394_c0_g1_i2.p1 TRINITY_DN394_c0_g1~~TRINITY_DN394_c0_g1_i2.p1  ORF type:complete len:193 (-),score=43.15 TRINITY_DN394_c0_g1_i2:29-574(-)
MGCNQSKQEDIKKDNEQRARTEAVAAGRPGTGAQSAPQLATSPTRAIGAPGSVSQDNTGLGMSYSERREGEADYFKDIIDRTAHNFIDVAVTSALEGKDALDRARDYSDKITKVHLPKPSSFFSLPQPSQATSYNLQAFLNNDPFDRDMVSKFSHTCASAVQAMKVEPRGELVVSFAEINA